MDKKTTNMIIYAMIGVVVILIIFLVVIMTTSGSTTSGQTSQQLKTLDLEDNEKVEINDQLLSNYVVQFLIAQRFGIDTSVKDEKSTNIEIYAVPRITSCDSSEINDELMANLCAAAIIADGEKKLFTQIENEPNKYIFSVDAIQEKSTKLFGKEIELAKLSNPVKNGKIEIDVVKEINYIPYKIKSIVLDQAKNEYTLTFDYVKYTAENYSANKLAYDESDIIATYTLKVKKVVDKSDKEKFEYKFQGLGC